MSTDALERMIEDVEQMISEMEQWSDDRFGIAIEVASHLLDELKDVDK